MQSRDLDGHGITLNINLLYNYIINKFIKNIYQMMLFLYIFERF